ncbi:hypothetical protein NHX12_008815 [Muraenolepis orangiensis]|uniref:Geminin coiled-coil domain-containing protein 1 n=1 Tax=Muraenolepis orangiensis TaxID=630683 RepID=A0A9Q0DQM5_9TELE|nr:hypothetical protein NHX12_008815 [Muraenolepis orangiensis]
MVVCVLNQKQPTHSHLTCTGTNRYEDAVSYAHIPPDMVQTYTSIPPDMVQSNTPLPPDMVQSYTPIPPDMVQSYTPIPPDMVQSFTPIPPDIAQSFTPIPPDMVQSNTSIPPDMVQSNTSIPPNMLQDTLQQREEELARLQQENDKLRNFLSSSFVRNLEEKVKGLSSDHRRNLKRSLQQHHRTDPNLNSCQSHVAPQHISKRVCRNLFPEFCSDPGPSGEPNLDRWVLQTLGLKDQDTIDPSASPSSFRHLTPPHSSSPNFSASASAILPVFPPSLSSSASDFILTSSQDPHNLTLSTSLQHLHALSANASTTATQHQDAYQLRYSPDQCTEISGHIPAMTTESYHPRTALLSPLTQGPKHPNNAFLYPLTQGLSLTLGAGGITPGPSGLGLGSASSPFPPRCFRATDSPQSSQLCPITASTPTRQTYATTEPSSHTPTPTPRPVPPFQTLTPPHTPRCHKDAVFRGSFSPSSSFKTHSFPQGQAFIRKDTQGCWNFTWIPKQEL